jgi:hypothetical protein
VGQLGALWLPPDLPGAMLLLKFILKISHLPKQTRRSKSKDFYPMKLVTSKLDLNLRKKLVKCYIWRMALYDAETGTLRAADQKYLESFEMWYWRRMEKISWIDHVRNEEV